MELREVLPMATPRNGMYAVLSQKCDFFGACSHPLLFLWVLLSAERFIFLSMNGRGYSLFLFGCPVFFFPGVEMWRFQRDELLNAPLHEVKYWNPGPRG